MSKATTANTRDVKAGQESSDEPDAFVPDRQVQREFSITPMTLNRWDHDPALCRLGWAVPIKIRNRNFRSRRAIEAFKATMLRLAIANRSKKVSS
jgi:hypothetical protein